MYIMLRVIYTNLDALVAAVPTRGREILKIAFSLRNNRNRNGFRRYWCRITRLFGAQCVR